MASCCGWCRCAILPAAGWPPCACRLIAAGVAIYGCFLQLFGVTGWREAVNALKARPRDLRG
jgi:hypothetical protein